jgi:hypothetical protein
MRFRNWDASVKWSLELLEYLAAKCFEYFLGLTLCVGSVLPYLFGVDILSNVSFILPPKRPRVVFLKISYELLMTQKMFIVRVLLKASFKRQI